VFEVFVKAVIDFLDCSNSYRYPSLVLSISYQRLLRTTLPASIAVTTLFSYVLTLETRLSFMSRILELNPFFIEFTLVSI
jgi:hypothetical protein